MGVDPHSPTVSSTDPLAGDANVGVLVGEYRLTRAIGRGGMGMVYAAEHVRLGRSAAVKLLVPELANDRKALQRFFAEAKIVAALQHPGVVDVIDVLETGTPGIVMELLRGRVLADVIAGGPMPVARAVAITSQILGVLAVVHRRGIVHRDLKPQNVFLVDDGVRSDLVKVLDFGIAKLSDGQAFGMTSTSGGAILGTPQYMSPEQIEGRPVDARTDLYSIGLMLHEMLVGEPTFRAQTLTALLTRHLLEPPPRIDRPDVTAVLKDFVSRCLAKRAEDRFSSTDEARRFLDPEAREGTPVPAIAQSRQAADPFDSTLGRSSGQVFHDARNAATRHRTRRIVGIAGAVCAVAVILVVALSSQRSSDSPRETVSPLSAPARLSEPTRANEPARASEPTPASEPARVSEPAPAAAVVPDAPAVRPANPEPIVDKLEQSKATKRRPPLKKSKPPSIIRPKKPASTGILDE